MQSSKDGGSFFWASSKKTKEKTIRDLGSKLSTVLRTCTSHFALLGASKVRSAPHFPLSNLLVRRASGLEIGHTCTVVS